MWLGIGDSSLICCVESLFMLFVDYVCLLLLDSVYISVGFVWLLVWFVVALCCLLFACLWVV